MGDRGTQGHGTPRGTWQHQGQGYMGTRGWGTWGHRTWGQEDTGTVGHRIVGTQGHGDREIGGHQDMGTRGHADSKTQGHQDTGTQGWSGPATATMGCPHVPSPPQHCGHSQNPHFPWKSYLGMLQDPQPRLSIPGKANPEGFVIPGIHF